MNTYVVAIRKGIRDIYSVLKSGELYGNVRTCTTHKRSEIEIERQLGSNPFSQYPVVTAEDSDYVIVLGSEKCYYRIDHIVFYGKAPVGAIVIPIETGCKNEVSV